MKHLAVLGAVALVVAGVLPSTPAEAAYTPLDAHVVTQTAVVRGSEYNTCGDSLSGQAGWAATPADFAGAPFNGQPVTTPVHLVLFVFDAGVDAADYSYVAGGLGTMQSTTGSGPAEIDPLTDFSTGDLVPLPQPVPTDGADLYSETAFHHDLASAVPVGSVLGVVAVGGTALRLLTVVDCSSDPTTYNLTVSTAGAGSGHVGSSDGGIDCGSTCSADNAVGATVTLTATPDAGWAFLGWEAGDCSGLEDCALTMDGPKVATAIFGHPTLTVAETGTGSGTVTSAPAGIDCPSTCSATYDLGDTVALTAAADAGSVFTGWSGECTGGGECDVTLQDIHMVTAHFAAVTEQPTASPASLDFGTVPLGRTKDLTVTITNTTTQPLQITTISTPKVSPYPFSGRLGPTETCYNTTIPPGGSCQHTEEFWSVDGAEADIPADLSVYDAGAKLLAIPMTASTGPAVAPGAPEAAPVANDDLSFVLQNTSSTDPGIGFDVLFNDVDPDADIMTISGTSDPQHLTVLGIDPCVDVGHQDSGPAQCLRLSTDVGYTGPAQVTYTISDGRGGTASAVARLLVEPVPPPTVTSVVPASGSPTGGQTVTITGANFLYGGADRTPNVHFLCGGEDFSPPDTTSTVFVSDHQLTTVTPQVTPFTGSCDIKVTNYDGQSGTLSNGFTYVAPPVTYRLTVTKTGGGSGTVNYSDNDEYGDGLFSASCGPACSATLRAYDYVVLTAAPAPGSLFTGWTTPCDPLPPPDAPPNSCGVSMTADVTVTANFVTPHTVTVAKNGNGHGTVTSAPAGLDEHNCGSLVSLCKATFESGQQVTLTAVPDPGGSTFVGWSGGGCSGTSDTCTVSTDADITVVPTFQAIKYSLTVAKTGQGSGTVTSDGGFFIDCGPTCSADVDALFEVTLTAVADPGSVFTGFHGACQSGPTPGTCALLMTSPFTVTADFAVPHVTTVVKDGNGSGTVSSSPAGLDAQNCGATQSSCSASFNSGQKVVLTEVPDAVSVFTGWSGGNAGDDCAGTGTTCTVFNGADSTVHADFVRSVYPLTITKTGAGSGSVTSDGVAGIDCGATCQADIRTSTVVTLTAIADPSSAFTGWSGDCTGTGSCVVTMTSAQSVKANFELLQTVTVDKPVDTGNGTVTSSPAGLSCALAQTSCSAQFVTGQQVVLTAVPAIGSTFAGWEGDGCTGTGPCTVTAVLGVGAHVTAHFSRLVYRLTVAGAGQGTGTVSDDAGVLAHCAPSCSGDYGSSLIVTLSATADPGSVFTGWTGDCTGSSTCVVTMTGPHSVAATFEKPHTITIVTDAGTGQGSVTSTPSGLSCPTSCTPTFLSGSTVQFVAVPSAGSTFAGWSGGGCAGTSTCTVSTDADVTVTVTFTKASYALTVAKIGTGTGTVTDDAGPPFGCGPVCTTDYVYGTQVILSATADPGSVFVGWTGDCTSPGPCVLAMTAARTVTARFDTVVTPKLPVVSFNPTSVTVTEGGPPGGFDLVLSSASKAATSVRITTTDGTATAGSDYTAVNQVVTVAAGVTRAHVTVPVTNDQLLEPSETLTATLSAPAGVTIGVGSASMTIQDNEPRSYGPAPRTLVLHKIWSAPATTRGLPDVTFTLTQTGPGGVTLNIASTALLAANGSACTTDAEKRVGCSLTLQVPPRATSVAEVEPTGWLAGYTDACSSVVFSNGARGSGKVGHLNAGTGSATCTVINTFTDPRFRHPDDVQPVLLREVWSDAVNTQGLLTVSLRVDNNDTRPAGGWVIPGTDLLADDGSPCDSVADMRAGCTITVGVRNTFSPALVSQLSSAGGWLPSYSGGCPPVTVPTRTVPAGVAGRVDAGATSTCVVTSTVPSPAFHHPQDTEALVLHETWSAPGNVGLPGVGLKVVDRQSGNTIWTVPATAMVAVDGTACDTDIDKRAGCSLTVGLRPGTQAAVVEGTPPIHWLPTYSGGCPAQVQQQGGQPSAIVGRVPDPVASEACTVTNVLTTAPYWSVRDVQPAVLREVWSAPKGATGLPNLALTVLTQPAGDIIWSVPSTDMRAADGTRCDSDADKRAGCTITVGMPLTNAEVVAGSPVGWLPSYSGGCPPSLVLGNGRPTGGIGGHLGLVAGATCVVTNTFIDPRYRANHGVQPLTLREAWTSTAAPPNLSLRINSPLGGPVLWSIPTSAFLAADGSPCDTAADKQVGCSLTVGLPLATVTGVTVPPIAAHWVPAYSGGCPSPGAPNGIPMAGRVTLADEGEPCVITATRV